jgi:hypothetical protein
MNHPDFRVGGRIFATLGYPNEDWAMVKLTQQDQKKFVRAYPKVFQPVKGGWGKSGATNMDLHCATITIVREALLAAWRTVAPKRLTKASFPEKNRLAQRG